MKKRNFIISLVLLGSLASCESSEQPCPPCEECTSCEECPTLTEEEQKERALKAKRETLEKALAKFKGDFVSKLEAVNSRKYDNPFNCQNNISVTYKVNNKYDHIENTDLVRFKAEGSLQRSDSTELITIPTEEGVYNQVSRTQVSEYLNFKNEVSFRDLIDEGTSTPLTMDSSIGENVFSELTASLFTLTTEDGPIQVKGEWLDRYIYKVIGFSSGIESVTATLENETITRIDFKYKDYTNRYSSTNFGGDIFVESLSGSITFEYKDQTVDGKKPVQGKPIDALDKVLSKFKEHPNNYTVKYGSSHDLYTHQILKDGEKVALDVSDLMSETEPALGTLTWLDARLEKREDGTFEVNNVAMNDTTGTLERLTNEEIIDQSLNFDENGNRLPDNQLTALPLSKLHVPANHYDLDFKSIDTRLLTANEAGDAFQITGDSAKYFGEALLSGLIDDSGFGITVGLYRQYTWTGITWTFKVVDENSISFEGQCALDLGGSSGKSTICGLITAPGTTDVSALYGELPSPAPVESL